MRTTLYSRLKPNYKAIVVEKSESYPSTAKCIVESLQKTLYSKLTICEITDLTLFLGIYKRTDAEWFSGKDLFNLEQDVA